jgi:hypothetical protein
MHSMVVSATFSHNETVSHKLFEQFCKLPRVCAQVCAIMMQGACTIVKPSETTSPDETA